MSKYVWLNGEIIPSEEARVSVHDAGFTHAAGLFETLRAYHGRVMRLHEHLNRMQHSADALGIGVRIDFDAIESGLTALLKANELTDARIRLVATPGHIPRAGFDEGSAPSPTALITAGPVSAYPKELYESGMRVCICPYRQNTQDPIAGHKTLAYLPRLLAMKAAADRRCNEALWFTTENLLAEGSVCNVFIVENESLITPPLNTPILPGTTRNSVLEIADEWGIDAREESIDIDRLLAANEVFLTGSVLEVMPVTSIEKHVVGSGTPGQMTLRVRDLYKAFVEKECKTNG